MNTTTLDLTTPEGVKALMESSTGEQNWDDNCDKVKTANSNDYPGFWYSTIIVSGLAARTFMKWS